MKIITLHQPWASLIALGLKRYETRHWNTSYRGTLLIHAAKKQMAKPFDLRIFPSIELVREQCPESFAKLQAAIDHIIVQPRYGCIVATTQLGDCREMVDTDKDSPKLIVPNPIYIQAQPPLERSLGLWESGRFAFTLRNAVQLAILISFTSRQGKLLDAPPEIVEAIQKSTL